MQSAATLVITAHNTDGVAVHNLAITLAAMTPKFVDTAAEAKFQQAAAFSFVVEFGAAACQITEAPILVMDRVDVRAVAIPAAAIANPPATATGATGSTALNQTATAGSNSTVLAQTASEPQP